MKIDFISDGSRQKNPSTAPAAEKDSRLEKPLKSGKMWIFKRCKNGKSDGCDGFWVGWQKTDPADPVGEKEGVCRRRDRLCGDEKQDWGM